MNEGETQLDPPAQADTFGEVAKRLGFLSELQLQEAVAAQSAFALAGLPKRLGEVLVEKNIISTEQLETVVRSQTVAHKRIGDYELLSKLGEGGMGAVFKAKQMSMDRIIALKVLSPRLAGNPDFRERFEREARAIAKLNHPNIVTGIDAGVADGYYYFAMEFVDGETLGQYLRRQGGKLSEREAFQIIRQVALALKHAHDNNLMHRDVKPDNILIDNRHHTAKLADLGLAREAGSSNMPGATKSGQAVGTPYYMSPEQARGKSLGPSTDIYSLGATLFHLLTGRIPFTGQTAAVIMARHITDPAQDPRDVNPAVSKPAALFVLKCLRKEPHERYPDAQEVLKDVDRILGGEQIRTETYAGQKSKSGAKSKQLSPVGEKREASEAPEVDAGEKREPVRPKRRRRFARREDGSSGILIIGLVVGVLLLGMLFLVFGNKKPPPRRTPGPAGK